jgi:hypothetical protein
MIHPFIIDCPFFFFKRFYFEMIERIQFVLFGLDYRIGCSLRSHHGRFVIYPGHLNTFISSTANIFAAFTPYREMSGILIYSVGLHLFTFQTPFLLEQFFCFPITFSFVFMCVFTFYNSFSTTTITIIY